MTPQRDADSIDSATPVATVIIFRYGYFPIKRLKSVCGCEKRFKLLGWFKERCLLSEGMGHELTHTHTTGTSLDAVRNEFKFESSKADSCPCLSICLSVSDNRETYPIVLLLTIPHFLNSFEVVTGMVIHSFTLLFDY